MQKILIFIALITFGLACGGSVPDEAIISKGEDIYKKYCVACHGMNGELAVNGAKKFSESTLDVKERILVITSGRNMMTPFKGILSEEEIKEVAAYTMILSKKK